MAEALLTQDAPRNQTRIGSGYDVHRWGPGGSVWLCGIEVPHDRTLIGHSDADAGLHALTDALLGAIAAGDIGDHFPPTDPKWRGASSDQFLLHAAELTAQRGGRIVNVDVTLICEHPKVKPHRQAMRDRIAALLDPAAGRRQRQGDHDRGPGLHRPVARGWPPRPWSPSKCPSVSANSASDAPANRTD